MEGGVESGEGDEDKDVVAGSVCTSLPEDGDMFSEEEEADGGKETVVSGQVLCAVVARTSLAGVKGVSGEVEVRGILSGGGWTSCRLSGGSGSEAFIRLKW